jgi:hypothetical protein
VDAETADAGSVGHEEPSLDTQQSRTMRHTLLIAILCLVSSPLRASDEAVGTLAQASERFASGETQEVPDFQRHVVPLLGKLGCNGRACHGSFQGRGGFQLSLFGYDFTMDHAGLTERIDTDDPDASYALHKALLEEPHEGGRRMDAGSWEHRLLRAWIAAGAAPRPEDPADLVRLEVTPEEIQFSASGETVALRTIAVWSDGMREDVTCLTRFQSNDEAIAAIDQTGLVTSGEPGDTHVVAFYDNAVVPVPVLRPVSETYGPRYPEIAASTAVDAHVIGKLRKLGIVPSDVCTDAEFLRRVSLDICGTLPTADEVRAFLADASSDKRARKIDQLLETPAYAAWWTTRLCDWTGCSDEQLNNVNPASTKSGSRDWYDWIYSRVESNVPYDELVEGIVVAKGRMGDESYADYCERLSDCYREGGSTFAEQPGLIYFWGRKNFTTAEDRAIGFAYTFMGTRIQCAQCHKHPFDVWTQDDFQQFEQFFARVDFSKNGADREEYNQLLEAAGIAPRGAGGGNDQRKAIEKAVQAGKTIPFPEIVIRTSDGKRAQRKKKNAPKFAKTARLLGAEEIDLTELDDPREALMHWLRHDEQQLFARAIVNRVWANYFHRGIVEPTDDLSLANPASNQELFDYLTQGFVGNDYNLKWLHREICRSDAYQRSWRPTDTNAGDERNFSRAVPRRLPAEVAYDALVSATADDEHAARMVTDVDERAIAIPGVGRRMKGDASYALTVFGRSTRESNCDCDRSVEASLLQVVFTRNDAEIHELIDRKGGWLAQVTASSGSDNSASTSSDADSAGTMAADELRQQLKQAEKRLERAKKSGNQRQVEAAQERIERLRKRLAALESKLDAEDAADSTPIVATESQPVIGREAASAANSLIDDAYLRTLSRLPSTEETRIASEYLAASESLPDGLRGLLWTLVNTREFIVNH